jgi:hypothetical protein
MIKPAIKQYAFSCLLVLVAIIFSYFWLKAEQPVISDDMLIQTEDKQGIFPYPSTHLNLDSGQIYSVRFVLKSNLDYEFFFKDKPLYLKTIYEHIEISHSDLSTPYELKFSLLNLPDPMYYNVYMVLQSDGGENGFIIKPKNISNLHTYKCGMLVALVAVLLLFALQWNKDFFANGNRISAIILSLLFCFVFQYFCRMLFYELSGVFNAYDSPIFWTVGRGIANGIQPYTGLFDIKPPGIFILSALSFYFFDSPILTHITQALVLLIIAMVPLLAYILHSKEKSIFGFAFSSLLGLLLALYSDERSGQVEVESFGAAFGALAILLMLNSLEKYKVLKILGISLCILISCGFKEPFLFPILGASFILCKNIKDWSMKFALPLLIALCFGVIALLSLGWMGGFLQYLFFMTGTHVNALGSSPLERAVHFWKLLDNQNLYSLGFGYLFACIFCALLWISRTKPLQILSLVAALFLASLSVALGGEYFCHHFIFAVPFYAAILIKYNINSKHKINAPLLVLLSLSILNLPDINWEKRSENFNHKKTTAMSIPITKYLDSVMEQSGIERFVNLCNFTNATVFICYSSEIGKYSPQGSYYIIDYRFFNRIPNYTDSVLNYVKNGQIAVYDPLGEAISKEFQKELKNILEELYTPIPWKEIEHIPKPEGIPPERILFRKREKDDKQ